MIKNSKTKHKNRQIKQSRICLMFNPNVKLNMSHNRPKILKTLNLKTKINIFPTRLIFSTHIRTDLSSSILIRICVYFFLLVFFFFFLICNLDLFRALQASSRAQLNEKTQIYENMYNNVLSIYNLHMCNLFALYINNTSSPTRLSH